MAAAEQERLGKCVLKESDYACGKDGSKRGEAKSARGPWTGIGGGFADLIRWFCHNFCAEKDTLQQNA